METAGRISSSFRDPGGFVFRRDEKLYRQVNEFGRLSYDRLMKSGLYDELVSSQLLISHEEVHTEPWESTSAYRVLAPDRIPFISYPYEWCFGQLKSAALATLEIQKRALHYDMSLKDASAYNIQFLRGRPICIDTLSLEERPADRPWSAYRQFCRHFVAPLLLMAYGDVRMSQLLKVHLDGIPLDLTSRILPWYSKLRPSVFTHVHLHARCEDHFESRQDTREKWKSSKNAQLGLLDNLQSLLDNLKWQPAGTHWAAYYIKNNNNYSDAAALDKLDTVAQMLERTTGGTVWDLGANTGRFSRLSAQRGMFTVSLDSDPAAVELNYADVMNSGETNILPLVCDLSNPSPGIGWNNTERPAMWERGNATTILALALVHHLAITHHLQFSQLANLFARKCRHLIIEFVPPSDSMVRGLLTGRESIFPDYRQDRFESAFSQVFEIKTRRVLENSERTLYLMESRGA